MLYVVMHGNKNKEALKKVLSPLLSKLNPSAWSVLNKNMLWNLKRPVWLQGLIDLIEPYILAVVDEMMDAVESGQMWTLSHVPEGISYAESFVYILKLFVYFFSYHEITKWIE